MKLHIPEYKYPEPHYLWIDLKLELGSVKFEELERWIARNKCHVLDDGPLVIDVERFLNDW